MTKNQTKTLAPREATITQVTDTIETLQLVQRMGDDSHSGASCSQTNYSSISTNTGQALVFHLMLNTLNIAPHSLTVEASIKQLTTTGWDDHLFNSMTLETVNTNPLKRQQRAKHHATRTEAPCEAIITQLTNTIGDAYLLKPSVHLVHV